MNRPAKGEQTRERILTTALALFAEKGFQETTMRDIAGSVGCSLGLAYRYFATKEAMALALYEQLVAEFCAEVPGLPSGRVAERWFEAITRDLDRLSRHKGALTGLISAGLTPGSKTQVLGAEALPMRQAMIQAYGELITEASDAPRPDIVGALATILYGVHLLLVLLWLQDRTAGQQATHRLIGCGRDLLGSLRLWLKLPGMSQMVSRVGDIVRSFVTGEITADN